MSARALWLVAAAATGLLMACGKGGDLRPKDGAALPPAPYGAAKPLSAEEMMKPSPQAKPVSEAELLCRSERRAADPFDLPPGVTPPPVTPAQEPQ